MAKPRTANGSVKEAPVSLFFYCRPFFAQIMPAVSRRQGKHGQRADKDLTGLAGFAGIDLCPTPQSRFTHGDHEKTVLQHRQNGQPGNQKQG